MPDLLTLALLAASAVIALPLAIFAAECWLALLPRRPLTLDGAAPRPRTVVLIPAHNEEVVIERTLKTLLPTLGPNDRALVVADNCTDRTAEIARGLGAIVVKRQDTEQRGKGYALDFGMRAIVGWDKRGVDIASPQHVYERRPTSAASECPLRNQPALAGDPGGPALVNAFSDSDDSRSLVPPYVPDVVLILDADCRVAPQTVETLARAAAATGRPVQALNLCDPGPDAESLACVSGLGIRFKNYIRPAGLAAIGMPCHLMGTGMALPWELAQSAQLATGQIVEDMNLGLELALSGTPALFVPEAEVTSPQPGTETAFVSQRTRWEHGHLATSLALVPRLAVQSILQCRLDLAALAIDLLVPPLSLAIGCWLGAMLATLIAGFCGASWLPAILLGVVGTFTFTGIAACWAVYCRDAIPLGTLLGLPWYFARKLPIYASFLARPQTAWVRTER